MMTPLMIAVCRGSTSMVKIYIGAGCEVDKPNDEGRTPLMIACAKGHTEIVVLLVEAGCKIETVDSDGNTSCCSWWLSQNIAFSS